MKKYNSHPLRHFEVFEKHTLISHVQASRGGTNMVRCANSWSSRGWSSLESASRNAIHGRYTLFCFQACLTVPYGAVWGGVDVGIRFVVGANGTSPAVLAVDGHEL